VGADSAVRLHDLALKSHERLFFERVPLPAGMRSRIRLPRGSEYADFAEAVEAWGFRAMQARGEFMGREEIAVAWFREEFEPIVAMLREAGIGEGMTDAELYSRVVALRYLILRTHRWDEEILERLREELTRRPSPGEDTLTHTIRSELRG
jgi:hypothetical protein